jgi:hypothetical protein
LKAPRNATYTHHPPIMTATQAHDEALPPAASKEVADIEVVADPNQTEKKTSNVKEPGDVEAGSLHEPEKGYYSKLSVWLMVLFSGLAIGSDG